MGKIIKALKNACSNDIKAINKSIDNIGRMHHASYMANIMFRDDINTNHRLLLEIQNAINAFYRAVKENYVIKKNAKNMLDLQYKNAVIFKPDFQLLTNKQLSEIVYQQAMKYYFRMEINDETDFSSYFDVVIQHRIMSNFLQNDIERILIKMYEDIEIVIEDTQNIEFLMRNYKKLNILSDKYNYILEQLAESIRNVVFRNSRFDDEYFITVRKISFILHQNFNGGQFYG